MHVHTTQSITGKYTLIVKYFEKEVRTIITVQVCLNINSSLINDTIGGLPGEQMRNGKKYKG